MASAASGSKLTRSLANAVFFESRLCVQHSAPFCRKFSASPQDPFVEEGSPASDKASVHDSRVRDRWGARPSTPGFDASREDPTGPGSTRLGRDESRNDQDDREGTNRRETFRKGYGDMGWSSKPIIRGVNKAIVAGEVGNIPVQRIRKTGQILTIFSVGTGGMHRSMEAHSASDQERETLSRDLQWHKIIVHDEKLGRFAMQRLRQGLQVYVEGELETRVFNDLVTGLVRREREIAVRVSGQILFFNDRGAYSIDANI